MVLDDLLLHAGHGLVPRHGHGRVLDALGGLGVGLEALILLGEGDGEVLVSELEAAPGVLLLARPRLLEAGHHLGQPEVVEGPVHRLAAHEARVVDHLGVGHGTAALLQGY